jgi:mannose PTS system EIIA component
MSESDNGTRPDSENDTGTAPAEKETTTAVIVVTHGESGKAMLAAAEKLVGGLPAVRAVRVETGEPREELEHRIEAAVTEIGATEVLFLVDLYGSTPARLCCRACAGHSMVLTGVNLAMLFKLATVDRHASARDLAAELAATGTKSIQVITGHA